MKRALLLLLPLAFACRSADPLTSRGETLVLHGGTIHLGDGTGATVDALVARDGRVIYAGNPASAFAVAGPDRNEIDLAGGTAVPGLQDAHAHLESLGAALDSVDLVGCTSYAELIERVSAQAALQEPGTWITGRGWDQTLWPGAEFPHHAELSAAVPEHPVLVNRVDGHAALANGKALAIAGLARVLPDDFAVEGGRVHVSEDGVPTGVLIDAAVGLVGRHVPDPDRATRVRRILRAQEHCLAAGLTCVHDMGVSPDDYALFRELAADGRLKLRVASYLWGNGGLDGRDYEALAREAPTGRLAVKGVKLMVDGALGSRGAALLEDYADEPGHAGLLMMDAAAYGALVARCAELGLQPATHAIGDRGNRMVLDAYAERAAADASFAELRPRVEHAQVVARDDWSRFRRLGVVPSMQPTHATSDMRWAEERLGPDRVLGAYAWRRLESKEAPLAFGSDFPVESALPQLGLYAARTRQDSDGEPSGGFQPDQRMDGVGALAGFTSGAAFALHEENERGQLAPGFFADVTVFDVDPVTGDPVDLLYARVLLTIVEGEVVHDGR